jgi:hypothetical protein
LRRSPLMEAGGAYPASVEGVPLIAATTRPAVILAGRPAAERAPNARAGRVEAFLLFGLAINNNRGVIRESAHSRLLSPSSDRRMWRKILSLLRKKSRPSFQIACLHPIESHCLFHAHLSPQRHSRSSSLSLANEPNVPAWGSNRTFFGPSDPPIQCAETSDRIRPVDLSVFAGYP